MKRLFIIGEQFYCYKYEICLQIQPVYQFSMAIIKGTKESIVKFTWNIRSLQGSQKKKTEKNKEVRRLIYSEFRA